MSLGNLLGKVIKFFFWKLTGGALSERPIVGEGGGTACVITGCFAGWVAGLELAPLFACCKQALKSFCG